MINRSRVSAKSRSKADTPSKAGTPSKAVTPSKAGSHSKPLTPKRATTKTETPNQGLTIRKCVTPAGGRKAPISSNTSVAQTVRYNYVDDEAVDVIVDDQKTKRNHLNSLQQQECLADEDQEALDVSCSSTRPELLFHNLIDCRTDRHFWVVLRC